MDDSGQKCLGLAPRGSPVTKMDSLGCDWPLSHPARVLLLVPPLPLHYTSAMGLNCRGEGEQHREQCSRASAFSYPAGRHLLRQKAGFVPSCTGTQFPTSLHIYPPLPPNPLVAPSVSTSQTSLLFPGWLLSCFH